MARIPAIDEIAYSWDAPSFVETFQQAFQRPIADAPRFFAALERVGNFQCSDQSRCQITQSSARFALRMKPRALQANYKETKRQLRQIYKKSLLARPPFSAIQDEICKLRQVANEFTQSDSFEGLEYEINYFGDALPYGVPSRIWREFCAHIDAADLGMTEEGHLVIDYAPERGVPRVRIAAACRKMLPSPKGLHGYDDCLGHGRGSRARPVSLARAREDWVCQVVRCFANDGGSLTISNAEDKKKGQVIDFVGLLYENLPPFCRDNIDLETVARHDIAVAVKGAKSKRLI
jgi:hypothetical protein